MTVTRNWLDMTRKFFRRVGIIAPCKEMSRIELRLSSLHIEGRYNMMMFRSLIGSGKEKQAHSRRYRAESGRSEENGRFGWGFGGA